MSQSNYCYSCLSSSIPALSLATKLAPVDCTAWDDKTVLHPMCDACASKLDAPANLAIRDLSAAFDHPLVLVSVATRGGVESPDFAVIHVSAGLVRAIKKQAAFVKNNGLIKVDSSCSSVRWFKGTLKVWPEMSGAPLLEAQLHVSDELFWFSAYPEQRLAKVLTEKFVLSVLDLPEVPEELKPQKVPATIEDDLNVHRVDFDASAWFEQAQAKVILQLAKEGWRSGNTADAVAGYFAKSNRYVGEVFSFCETTPRDVGFCVSVDRSAAMAWLKEHRKCLWARVVCQENQVRLVWTPNASGLWDWVNEAGACGRRFGSIEEAALDAVRVLGLE